METIGIAGIFIGGLLDRWTFFVVAGLAEDPGDILGYLLEVLALLGQATRRGTEPRQGRVLQKVMNWVME